MAVALAIPAQDDGDGGTKMGIRQVAATGEHGEDLVLARLAGCLVACRA